ncbi:unnamed protein product [Triticum turgidum subsp. durum]|uniref:F-box domain-containing protein n=1 Tax=Triticum turgidum subsp. durum TaxID=4567 RepID=A0A9R0QJL9_TRITD|nr:unnamed protein product [Triticum turgidum subsp. durum]
MAPPPPPPPAALPDELVEEILLRLPPDDPACLLHSSLISKAWGGAVSGPGFRRRLYELHGAPPMLGLLHNQASEPTRFFAPTTASPFSLVAPDPSSWLAIGCRHGRALFLPRSQEARKLLVWDPITGAQHLVPVPAASECRYLTAAVLCAADGCDHRGCLGGPFHVLFVFPYEDHGEYGTSACVYSSETGAWGEPTSTRDRLMGCIQYSSVVVGSSLLYFVLYDYQESWSILEYDLSRGSLTVFSAPDVHCDCLYNLMLTEDNGLGVIQHLHPHLKLWTREASGGTKARWALSRVIDLPNLLPTSACLDESNRVLVVGFAEGANAIFVSTIAGIFAIELQSEQVRKVCDQCCFLNVVPVVTFYTPMSRRNHQNLLLSKPGEEAGGEEGGEEEKTVNQAQQLADHGSNAIKEGDFVNTSESIRHDHNIS